MKNKEAKIIVFGGCSVDFIYNQNIDGSYDEKPTLVAFGGKGSNQAVACSRAGAQVYIISRLGGKNKEEKERAKEIIENLQENKVNVDFVEIVEGVINDVSQVRVSLKGDNDIIRKTGAIDCFNTDMIKKYSEVFRGADFVVAQTKVPKDVTVELINFCHKNNIFLVLTPCRPLKMRGEKALLNKVDIITCNYDECCKMFGELVKNEDGNDKYLLTEEKFEKVLKEFSNKLIVTLGRNGLAYHNGEKVAYFPALEAKSVVDTTGAGDTFNGNLVAALADGRTLEESILRGMKAATFKLQFSGAQTGMPDKRKMEEIKESEV